MCHQHTIKLLSSKHMCGVYTPCIQSRMQRTSVLQTRRATARVETTTFKLVPAIHTGPSKNSHCHGSSWNLETPSCTSDSFRTLKLNYGLPRRIRQSRHSEGHEGDAAPAPSCSRRINKHVLRENSRYLPHRGRASGECQVRAKPPKRPYRLNSAVNVPSTYINFSRICLKVRTRTPTAVSVPSTYTNFSRICLKLEPL